MPVMKTLFPCLLSPVRLAALTFLVGPALPFEAGAAAPSWWQERGVMDASQTLDDYSAVNVGQLKHMAKQAMLELDQRLPGGAGTAIHQMVAAWSTQTPERNDFAAVNIGQLKAVTKLFYDRLNEAGAAASYPWSTASENRDDYAAVNTGQLKHVFSFEVPDLSGVDSDGDGLNDGWETAHGFNPMVLDVNTTDTDSDGLTLLMEALLNTNPYVAAMTDTANIAQLKVYSSGF